MTLPVIFPSVVVSGGKPSISYTDSDAISAAATTQTFTAKNIGTASSRRTVIVCLRYNAASPITTSMTIGGVSATEVHSAANGSARQKIYVASVPTGTTANIVVIFSSASAALIGVWSAYNLLSNTPTDTATFPLDLDISARGVAVGYVSIGGSLSWTWTGLSEDFDSAPTGTHSGASYTATTAQTPLTITATPSGAGTSVFISAAFR